MKMIQHSRFLLPTETYTTPLYETQEKKQN
jgi:hypothetical protein